MANPSFIAVETILTLAIPWNVLFLILLVVSFKTQTSLP